MQRNGIKWKELDFWNIFTKTTIYGSIAIFITLLLIGIFSYFITSNFLPFLIFFIIGVLCTLSWMASLIYTSKKVPKKVGFNSKNIYYIERKGREKKIHFSEIKKIVCSIDAKGGLEIQKDGGAEVVLGPGLGGNFGKSLLDEYCLWVKKNTSLDIEIKEEEIGWAKLRRYVVIAPT